MIEFTMINVINLYQYTRTDGAAIALSIPGACMCGSPTVGNLGRKY